MTSLEDRPIRTALLSVSDKSGIVDLAKQLIDLNITLLSTGGTASCLREHGVDVMDVSDVTGFPEIMNGRVKTLHPNVHAGILARRLVDDAVLAEHNIQAIDLVVVNLYPFRATIAKEDCDLATAVENIDVGGPTMIRAAAKNHADVSVVVNPNDYDHLITELQQCAGSISGDTRFRLAAKAFEHTAQYDAAISDYFHRDEVHYPSHFHANFSKQSDLRYGENPHQTAAFYVKNIKQVGTISAAKQLQGKALSFNNIADSDAALECVKEFTQNPSCVIVKHANPCGIAMADSLLDAYQRAFQTDPTSSFGGIIAFNRCLDEVTAKAIIDKQFVEVIIAPEFSAEALIVLQEKPNVRVLACGEFQAFKQKQYDYKKVAGGLLVQERDTKMIQREDLTIVSKRKPSEQEIQDCLFAWRIVKHVKSNAIVYAKDNASIGVGAGQMSRVVSAQVAGIKAQDADLPVSGSVMASDAFFPFRDGIDQAANLGITAVIQPGGSIRDEEIIQAADEADMAMIFTGVRHFKH